MTSVAVGEGPGFSVGQSRSLFPTGDFPFSPNHHAYHYDAGGDRFLMVREVTREGSDAELILVENFIEEVRARVGGQLFCCGYPTASRLSPRPSRRCPDPCPRSRPWRDR